LIELLEVCFLKLQSIVSDKAVAANFNKNELEAMRRHFYDQLDLLAQLYGFFCVPTRKCAVFKIKFELLRKDTQLNEDCETLVLTENVTNLARCYLDLNQLDNFDGIIEFLMENKKRLSEMSDDEIEIAIDAIGKHRLFNSKDMHSAVFKLSIAHYLFLRRDYEKFAAVIEKRIFNLKIFKGDLTRDNAAIKSYLSYLLFLHQDADGKYYKNVK
jgi:hypothetical protein